MEFEWDPQKAADNIAKHGLSFQEAATLFDLPAHLILEEYDIEHSNHEDRIRSIGPIKRGVILVVSTEKDEGNILRIISARIATPSERRRYADMIAGV